MAVHPKVAEVTARIIARSLATRTAYMQRVAKARVAGATRGRISRSEERRVGKECCR